MYLPTMKMKHEYAQSTERLKLSKWETPQPKAERLNVLATNAC